MIASSSSPSPSRALCRARARSTPMSRSRARVERAIATTTTTSRRRDVIPVPGGGVESSRHDARESSSRAVARVAETIERISLRRIVRRHGVRLVRRLTPGRSTASRMSTDATRIAVDAAADGSCRLEMGNTAVEAIVHGPRERRGPREEGRARRASARCRTGRARSRPRARARLDASIDARARARRRSRRFWRRW